MPTQQLPWNPGDDLFTVVDAQETVTVKRVNPDTGATIQSSANVPAFDPRYVAKTAGAGPGGEVPDNPTTFWLLASAIAFVPKPRDDVYRDDGTVWSIQSVAVEAFGTFYVVDCVRTGY